MPEKISTERLAWLWTLAALAFVCWCAYFGWAWVTFYEHSGAMRGVLVGLGAVSGVLLFFYALICVLATDEWTLSN